MALIQEIYIKQVKKEIVVIFDNQRYLAVEIESSKPEDLAKALDVMSKRLKDEIKLDLI